MFLRKQSSFGFLKTILIILLNQHFLVFLNANSLPDLLVVSITRIGEAQQNFLDSTSFDKSVDQFLTTKIWTKNLSQSLETVVNRYSDALPHSIQQSESRSQILKALPISCYECNSYFDPDCITHPEKFEKNCTNSFEGSDYVGCRKIDQWVDYSSGDELKAHHRVIRQCAADGDISKPCYYRAGYGGRINACFCDKDLCNSSLSLKAINIEILFVLMFSFFIIYRFSDKF